MPFRSNVRHSVRALITLSALIAFMPVAHARSASPPPPDHWVGTWSASPVALSNDAPGLGLPVGPASPVLGAQDTTLRLIVHTSLGGPLVRVVFSNEFGTDPLTLGAVHLALAAGANSINLFSANALTFNGSPSITIPPGASAVSDPAALKLPAFADLAISIFVPAQPVHIVSGHGFANQTSYLAPGNTVSSASLPASQELTSWPLLKDVDVMASGNSGAVVCFGDSITDGAKSTPGANRRWPDVLAHRLEAGKKTHELAILNQGIGGNRVLHDGTGPSALARFDRDVLAQAGVRDLILLESINDIGQALKEREPASSGSSQTSAESVTPDQLTAQLIQALAQLVARAHGHGIKVFVATLPPYLGADYSSLAGDQVRQAVNQWIRTSNTLDGFIDFDKATRDPARPGSLASAADSGDHLHPSDGGYKRMADSIDLKLFEDKRP